MFNNKRIEELEKKVELILDHLGLEYQPRLVEKDFGLLKDIKIGKIDLQAKDIGAKVEAITKIPDIETLKAICPFYHKDEQIAKEPKEKIYKIRTKVCKDCGREIKGTNKKQYCDSCIVLRRAKNQKKYTKQRHERMKKAKEILSQEKKEQSDKDWEHIQKGAVGS